MRNMFKLVDGSQAIIEFPFLRKMFDQFGGNIYYFWEIISDMEG